jgi:hypothetical protein
MFALQLAGQVAFSGASLVLGAKLLLTWRRTREAPELGIGLAFLLGGGVGYLAWLALAVAGSLGTPPARLAPVMLLGLLATCTGAIANGIGIAKIFRPGARWTAPVLGALALFMAATVVATVALPPERASQVFWAGLLAIIPIYAWAAGEAFALASTLSKRARIGLADPIVVHRIFQWGMSGTIVVVMTSLSFAGRLAYGPVLPPWVSALNAALGMGSALVIWLGFFPPSPIRERLARAYAS